jgi:hypothetical protein
LENDRVLEIPVQKLDHLQIAIEVVTFTQMDPLEPPVSEEWSIPR